MASLRRDIDVGTTSEAAWDALRDFGAVHDRLARGFVTHTRMEDGDRIVTFADGGVARERLITRDDACRRLVYSVVEGRLGPIHHQASVEVVDAPEGRKGCRLVWRTDVLPDHLARVIEPLMDQGAAAIARTLAR
jgi:hypothetical protein